jgi:hypothetical protein
MQGMMQRFLRWETLLFVGCSATLFDPNFETLLRWSNELLRDAKHRHFVLCREDEEGALWEKLKQCGMLEPLVYGKFYEDLVPYLTKLSEDSGIQALVCNPPFSDVSNRTPTLNVQKPSDIWEMQFKR